MEEFGEFLHSIMPVYNNDVPRTSTLYDVHSTMHSQHYPPSLFTSILSCVCAALLRDLNRAVYEFTFWAGIPHSIPR